jgi:hypothetical protein
VYASPSYADLKDYFDLFLRKAKRRAGSAGEYPDLTEEARKRGMKE